MNRSEMREQAFVLLYESEFFKDKPVADLEEIYIENIDALSEYGKKLFEGAVLQKDELDGIVEKFLKGWTLARISKVNLAILRLALYEIINCENVPESVVINEAVELAKKYSGADDSKFINGILGSFSRSR